MKAKERTNSAIFRVYLSFILTINIAALSYDMNVFADDYTLEIPDIAKMSPEGIQQLNAWIQSLPQYHPLVSGRPCIACNPDGSLPDEVVWTGYVGFPRDQGACQNCWAFASVGMVEVQYAINCSEPLLSAYCCPDPLSGNCPPPLEPIHLSVQMIAECSLPGIITGGCSVRGAGFLYGLENYFIDVGTMAIHDGFMEFELEDLEFDRTEFPGICPLLDRGSPGDGYHERNEVSDIEDMAPPELPLEFFRIGFDIEWDFFKYVETCPYHVDCDYTPLLRAIAQGLAVHTTSTIDRHALLVIGYKDGGDTLVVRNSHGEPGPIEIDTGYREYGDINLVVQVVNKYDGVPEKWLYGEEGCPTGSPRPRPENEDGCEDGDEDDDGIKNIYDQCLYIPDENPFRDDDEDFWPDDDPPSKGCDLCPGMPIPFNWDSDGDGVGDACDACEGNDDSLDFDKDGRPDGCDNCTRIPNYEQDFPFGNCHAYVESPPSETCEDGVCSYGDACDPEPCLRPIEIDSRGEDSYGRCDPRVDIRFGFVGFDEAGGIDSSLTITDNIENAFCDCSSGDYRQCTNLPPFYCLKDLRVEDPNIPNGNTGPGYHYLLRWEDMQRGKISRDFVRLFKNEPTDPCSDIEDERSAQWGCYPEQESRWYDTMPAGILNSTGDQTTYWKITGEEEFGFAPAREWHATPILYFNVINDLEPDYEHAYYTKSVYTIDIECPLEEDPVPVDPPPDMPVEVPDDGMLSKVLEEIGRKDIMAMQIWSIDAPELPPDPYRYATIGTNSYIQAMAVVEMKPYNGRVSEVYRTEFESEDDIIDVAGFSSVREPELFPKEEVMMTTGNGIPGTVYIFGGRDAQGFRNDLWCGNKATSAIAPGEIVWRWIKYEFFENGQLPQGRSQCALFLDSWNGNLIVWGGKNEQGALNDLWILDLETMQWSEVEAGGVVPPPLSGFSYTQGVEAKPLSHGYPGYENAAVMNNQIGYIWGGEIENGQRSNELYSIDLSTGVFTRIMPRNQPPPPMSDASIYVDDTTKYLYLYGGNDGIDYHNWIWGFDPESRRWWLKEDDCLFGICPPMSRKPALVSCDFNSKMIVFPGPSMEPDELPSLEAYFVHRTGKWENGRMRDGCSSSGDCDGDGQNETYHDALCTSYSEWWNLPGRMACDTFSNTLACNQDPSSEADVYRKRIPGLKAFRTEGTMLYALKGSKIISVDVSDLTRASILGELVLPGGGVDFEIYDEKAVVGADSRIYVVDISDPRAMTMEREIMTCGRVAAVELWGDYAVFLTATGIGKVDINGQGTMPEIFKLFLPVFGGQWCLIDVPADSCEVISMIGERAFRFHGFNPGYQRPAYLGNNRLYVRALRDLVVINVTPQDFEIESIVSDIGLIQAVYADDRYAYLNLRRGETQTIDFLDPVYPEALGPHTIFDMVDGIEISDGTVFRKKRNRIEAAVLR